LNVHLKKKYLSFERLIKILSRMRDCMLLLTMINLVSPKLSIGRLFIFLNEYEWIAYIYFFYKTYNIYTHLLFGMRKLPLLYSLRRQEKFIINKIQKQLKLTPVPLHFPQLSITNSL